MKRRRLDQLLANLGYCSRSQARRYVADGRVEVDGEVADDFGARVDAALVKVDGEPLDHPDGLLIMLHKPVGYICSRKVEEGALIYDLLPPRWCARNPGISSIGRLDKDTSGLLLITDQSTLIHQWTSPKHKVPKTYLAQVDAELTEDLVGIFDSGKLMLDEEETPCLPAALRLLGPREAEVILHEGRYHQVRRMFAAVGYTVKALHRPKFGEYELGDLAEGEHRVLALPSQD